MFPRVNNLIAYYFITESYHVQALHLVCRLCGKTRQAGTKAVKKENLHAWIYKASGIDINVK